jgi:hypothetical protein
MRQSSYEDKHLPNRNHEEVIPNSMKLPQDVLSRMVELDQTSFVSTRIDLGNENQQLLPEQFNNRSAPRSMNSIIKESTSTTLPFDPSHMPAVIMY